jgi:prolyl-tRNA synthetase
VRYGQLLIPTMKETPADAQVISHRLMVRGGMIRKVAAGIYNYLPLGLRVLQKISDIVREEMNGSGAQEILMPAVQPAELWRESGRWQQYGPELLRLQDRKNAEFCIGPTHEEVVVDLVRDTVQSYRQLPLNLYQIQTKFRDEIRPRFGLMRGREFIMKDAYSFDIDEGSALSSYDSMFAAYQRIFSRCGLEYRAVEADTGSIGGNRSHEFQVLAQTGEDAIVHCSQCSYAANVELAEIERPEKIETQEAPGTLEKVSTPNQKTIEEVAHFLGVDQAQVLKAVLFLLDEETNSEKAVMALCRGDHDINEVKLKRSLGAETCRMLTDDEIQQRLGSVAGYAGPVGILEKDAASDLTLVADFGLQNCGPMVCGANEENVHFVQTFLGRDFEPAFYDLRTAAPGDPCGRCGTPFLEARGIEVGHVFFLGDKYSKSMGLTVLNESGDEKNPVMGCYGIGIGRTAAAAIEQNHDDDGMIWPFPIAPFQVSLVSIGKDDEVLQAAEELYEQLSRAQIEVLFDDRQERPGVKFKDHDLIGCPIRVAVGGRALKEGQIEVKRRTVGRDGVIRMPRENAAEGIRAMVDELRAPLS